MFGGLATGAYYYLHVQQATVDVSKAFSLLCPAPETGLGAGAGPGAYRAYTGLHELDFIPCLLVNVFDALLTAPFREANIPLLMALPVVWYGVLLDAATLFPNSLALSIGIPAVLGAFVQLKGAGLGLPIYWLFSHFARAQSRAESQVPLQPGSAHVMAATVAVALGAVPTTIAMCVWSTYTNIAVWQPFPLYCALIQIIYFFAFASKKGTPSTAPNCHNFHITQYSYVIFSALVTVSHIPFLRTVLSSPKPLDVLHEATFPYPDVYTYPTLDHLLQFAAANEIRRFIQWDVLFIGVSSFLAGAWPWAFANPLTTVLTVLAWVISGPLLGPGFQASGAFMMQLWRDEKTRRVAAKAGKNKSE